MKVQEWLGESNTLGIDIWNKKYRYNNESFDEWLDRVSGDNKHIKQLIIDKKFLFAGRILAGRGIADNEECKRTLSNCYVLPPVEDNLESIFDTAKYLARTYSYGGGVGVDISNLAPSGARVRNSAKSSTGAVSFMELFSLTTGLIGQTHRQGALIITMDVSHPDIEKFITIKSDTNKVTKANISVKITDEFMNAVKNDDTYELYYKREETGEIFKRQVNAKDLFALICRQAWDNAEPGVLFWNTILRRSLMSKDKNFKPAGVNPCGEQVLPAGGACLLGSINLAEFVTEDKKFDFEEFRIVVFEAINAMNTVLDEGWPLHPLEIQRDSAYEWRPMGLGIMGLADMLIKMEIVYGSQESFNMCDKIGYLMAQCAISQSIEEAENHCEFPNCNRTNILSSAFFKEHAHVGDGVKLLESGIRNCQLLCLAPTGTISTMLNVSGGIEPIFDLYYERKTETLNEEEKIYKVYTQIVWDYMQEHGISEDEDDKLPEWFVTSKKIPYQDRIKMQAVWQKHIDVSISSTVNLPEETTVEDVMDLYMMAWEEGLKGVTIFREGCKRAPILNSVKKDKKEKHHAFIIEQEYARPFKEVKEELTNRFLKGIIDPLPLRPEAKKDKTLERGEVIKAPENSIGKKRDLITGCGSLHFQAFFDQTTGDVVETYLSKGSEGGCNSFMIGLSRMISLAGRAGVDVYAIADQLKSALSCPSYISRRHEKKDTSKGTSCPSAIGHALIEMYEDAKEEIEFGGVYKGSPLYHKLKAERDADKEDAKMREILNTNDEDEEPEIGPVPKEVFDSAVKDLAEETDAKIYAWINEGNNRERSAILFSTLVDHPYFVVQLAEDIKKGKITSIEDLVKKIDHGLKPVGMGSISPFFADIQDNLKNHYADTVGLCPECGNPLTFEGGCNTCKCCGWSKCD